MRTDASTTCPDRSPITSAGQNQAERVAEDAWFAPVGAEALRTKVLGPPDSAVDLSKNRLPKSALRS